MRKLLKPFPRLEILVKGIYHAFKDAFRREGLKKAYHLPDLRSGSEKNADLGPDGLPLPSPEMRHWVAGTDDLDWFLEGGQLGEKTISNLLQSQGLSTADFEDVLDFGCGCGRVIRFLNPYIATRLHGSDINAEAIQWCDQNLEFAEFATNHLAPPLRYRDDAFDLVYAFSVFTHLSARMQTAWMNEMRRVIKPGGYLLVSLHGEFHIRELSKAQQAAFHRGELVISGDEYEGHNICAAFHPEPYVREVFSQGFDVVEAVPQGALGNPRQDAYLLKKQV